MSNNPEGTVRPLRNPQLASERALTFLTVRSIDDMFPKFVFGDTVYRQVDDWTFVDENSFKKAMKEFLEKEGGTINNAS